jgi:pyochelin biosynthetic protein PchC
VSAAYEHWRTWLRRYVARPDAALKLVCLPHAGGAASFFRSWALLLPPSVELLAVQYPGREDRLLEPHLDEMERLADAVAGAIAPVLDRPVALFGHSMGAAVAYEVAQRLEERSGEPLAHLFVSGHVAPDSLRKRSKHLASDDVLWNELRRLNGTKEDVLEQRELRSLVLPYLRSDYRLSETYRPGPPRPLRCPITVLLGDRDPEVTVDEAAGWTKATTAGCELLVFPGGDHFYLVPEQAATIAALVRRLDLPAPAALAHSLP